MRGVVPGSRIVSADFIMNSYVLSGLSNPRLSADANVARFVAKREERYVRQSGIGYDWVGFVSFPATRTCLCFPSHFIMSRAIATLSHEVINRQRLCMNWPLELFMPQAQLCTTAVCRFHLCWNAMSLGINHPIDDSGHSKETSPPCLRAVSAMRINLAKRALLFFCSFWSCVRYSAPCFLMLTSCHLHHAVQGMEA